MKIGLNTNTNAKIAHIYWSTPKKQHFNNLNVEDVFWKTIKPFFTEKSKTNSNNSLTEYKQRVTKDKKTCQIINTYFINIPNGQKLPQEDKF